MRPKCIAAVNAAAGKPLTDAQLKKIEDGMSAGMRRLAREDPIGYGQMTRDQQMAEGAKLAMQDIKAQAKRALENAQTQILKAAETEQRVQQLQYAMKGTRAQALKRDFELTHIQTAAERKIAFGGLTDLIEAAGDTKGVGLGRKFLMHLFDAENPGMTRDIVKEIFRNADGHTGNEIAQAGARAWLDTIENLRTRFNNAGGDVGRLDYGYVPQPHSTAAIRKAGSDAWVEKTLPLMDRSRYVKDDGAVMNEGELRDFLKGAYETLKTEGLNKQEPGQFKGTGSRANKGSDTRQIHFKDGDSWLAYMREFGKGSIYDAMIGHVGGVMRDTGLVERYGPDANATARLQMDLVTREDGKPEGVVAALRTDPEVYWNMISGKTGSPKNETLANTMSMVRNLQSAAKLGGAVISSFTDLGTLAMTTGYNRMPYWRLTKDIGSQASKETRDWMTTHGMIAESLASDLNRWSGDHVGSNWSGKLSNTVLRLSLLNAWTDSLRQGFTLSMNAKLAEMAKGDWNSLHEFDRSRFTRSGVTEADWATLQTVAPEVFKGRELLTPQAIKDAGGSNELAAKVFGFIHDESEFAVVNPDLETRARMTWGGTQAGTAAGEIARTVNQFKAFPIAMVTRHWNRMLEGSHGADGAPLLANRAAYTFALLATLTGLGAISTQVKQVLQGKDPIDMTKPRFWLKAIAQGGGFSIAGDLFFVDPATSSTDAATTAVKNLAGPTVGAITDLVLKNITENLWQAAEGKDTHWEAELFNYAKAQTPALNLWWLKPMMEHGFTNAMNESMSPGYSAKQQQRAAQQWGQKYWWRPQDTTPQRAPQIR